MYNLVPRGREPFGQRRGSGRFFQRMTKGTPGDEVGACIVRRGFSRVFFSDISTPLAAAYHGKLTATFSFIFLLLWTRSTLHFPAVIVWIFSFFVLCDASQAVAALVPNYNFMRRLLDESRV